MTTPAFIVMVNPKPITFVKHDVIAAAGVGGNQVFSTANHRRRTGQPIYELELGILGDRVVLVHTVN